MQDAPETHEELLDALEHETMKAMVDRSYQQESVWERADYDVQGDFRRAYDEGLVFAVYEHGTQMERLMDDMPAWTQYEDAFADAYPDGMVEGDEIQAVHAGEQRLAYLNRWMHVAADETKRAVDRIVSDDLGLDYLEDRMQHLETTAHGEEFAGTVEYWNEEFPGWREGMFALFGPGQPTEATPAVREFAAQLAETDQAATALYTAIDEQKKRERVRDSVNRALMRAGEDTRI